MPPTPDQTLTITRIVVKLASLGHEVTWAEPITVGPLVTTYRFQPKAQSKVSAIVGLTQDLALVLGVNDVMIQRLPGEHYIGVTVPNAERHVVLWRDTLGDARSAGLTSPAPSVGLDSLSVPVNFGVDAEGRLFRDDLTRMPHLLIAGSTDSGKSTLLSSIIASIIYWRSPEDVELLLSDTKAVEFGAFTGAPHLRCDPMTTTYQTLEKMDGLTKEIDARLARLAKFGYQNIGQFKAAGLNNMPYIVLVIDELADFFPEDDRAQCRVSGAKLGRIVQKSRATGIHVIAATQRPSVNVVSGSIKANFPARLSFRLPSETDSRTVLGQGGAEHLLSRGDMLFLSPSRPALLRLHSALADQRDIRAAVEDATLRHAAR